MSFAPAMRYHSIRISCRTGHSFRLFIRIGTSHSGTLYKADGRREPIEYDANVNVTVKRCTVRYEQATKWRIIHTEDTCCHSHWISNESNVYFECHLTYLQRNVFVSIYLSAAQMTRYRSSVCVPSARTANHVQRTVY